MADGAGGRLPRVLDFDVLLAALAFAALLIEPVIDGRASDVTPAAVGLALLTAAPLVSRRRSPLGVLAVEAPLMLGCLLVFHPSRAAAAIVMLLVFTVGVEGDRARSLAVGAAMAAIVTTAVLITARDRTISDLVAYPALVLAALAAGDALRARNELQRARYEEAQRAREVLVQRRFDAERLRMAHELHDVIGHALVAINVRAAAASHLERHRDKGAVTTAFDDIAATSAEALAELRSAVGSLRSESTTLGPLQPEPSLEELPQLIARVHSAGLPVTLEAAPPPAPVPSGVALAAYRIVQESLTNVLRHSTATSAHVRVAYNNNAMVLEVSDDGDAKSANRRQSGHGLAGMRERAAALGGVCRAGRRPEGGWCVEVRIPLTTGST